jgi:peptidoglycan/xylan/chitin deacetylase (PgdA/CDA1 family)
MGLGTAYYRGLALLGLPRRRRTRLAAGAIFCFHNVVGDDLAARRGDRSLHVPVAAFRRYAAWISSQYQVVPLIELVERLDRGGGVAGLAAITFDDGYAGLFRHALPVLREIGAPATVFVVSNAPEAPAPFWWDRLADDGDLSALERERCLTALAGDGARVLREHPAALGVTLPDDFQPAAWSQLQVASREPGLDIGAHSVTHPNLAELPAGACEGELLESRQRIAERLGRVPAVFAYPYGRFTAQVQRACRDAGYRAAVSLRPDPLTPHDDRWALPRVNVPAGISLDALACRAAGLQWKRG